MLLSVCIYLVTVHSIKAVIVLPVEDIREEKKKIIFKLVIKIQYSERKCISYKCVAWCIFTSWAYSCTQDTSISNMPENPFGLPFNHCSTSRVTTVLTSNSLGSFGFFVLQVSKIKLCKDNVCPFVTSFGLHSVCGIPPYRPVLSQSFYSLCYVWHPFVWLYHTLFIHTSVDRHLNSVFLNVLGFPGSTVVKNSVQMQDMKRHRYIPWVRKSPSSRKWQSPPVFLPRKFHGQRSLVGYSPWGHKE